MGIACLDRSARFITDGSEPSNWTDPFIPFGVLKTQMSFGGRSASCNIFVLLDPK